MAASHRLVVDQGETFRHTFTYALPPVGWVVGMALPAPESCIPIDLTGCTARMQIRDKYGAPVLVELTTENGGIALGGASGKIDLHITHLQTDALGVKEGSARPRESAVYDLEVHFPSGDVKRVAQGDIDLDPNITRAV